MSVGRKPKPTALKVLQGNPGKRALNKFEPKPSAEIPTCPKHLNKVARGEWKRISKELATLGLLSAVDRAALAAYCACYARWVDAEQQLQKHAAVVATKSGNAIQNPYVGIANRALELMAKFLTEFGMTPSSRSRLHVEAATPTESNVWDQLLSDIPSDLPELPVQPQGEA